jgi:hypothetical protein
MPSFDYLVSCCFPTLAIFLPADAWLALRASSKGLCARIDMSWAHILRVCFFPARLLTSRADIKIFLRMREWNSVRHHMEYAFDGVLRPVSREYPALVLAMASQACMICGIRRLNSATGDRVIIPVPGVHIIVEACALCKSSLQVTVTVPFCCAGISRGWVCGEESLKCVCGCHYCSVCAIRQHGHDDCCPHCDDDFHEL